MNSRKNLKWLFNFTILNEGLICSIFVMNQLVNFVIDPYWISVITKNCFMWNKIWEDIFNSFWKYIDIFSGLRQFLATESPLKMMKIYDVRTCLTNNCNTHIDQYLKKLRQSSNEIVKNHTLNVVKKLFPDPFLKTQNWAYIWVNSLKFYTVCFYCMSRWRLSK